MTDKLLKVMPGSKQTKELIWPNEFDSFECPTTGIFVLFDLILYVPSKIFQLNRDVSSLVEPVLS